MRNKWIPASNSTKVFMYNLTIADLSTGINVILIFILKVVFKDYIICLETAEFLRFFGTTCLAMVSFITLLAFTITKMLRVTKK